MPGGRLEPGESPAEAAVRELLEETGLAGRPVRELGVLEQPSWRIPELRDENHFLHAVPSGPTIDHWNHVVEGGAFRCRWIPLLAGMSVYGEHGAFLDALLRKRVVGYVTRGRELLVFDHAGMPEVPTQVPAGRVDAQEELEEGLRREVAEETGVVADVVGELAGPAEFARLYGTAHHESHAFHALANSGGPDEWEHSVGGTGVDAGLVFACRWVSLDDSPPLWGGATPWSRSCGGR